jgi:hypothetical protein
MVCLTSKLRNIALYPGVILVRVIPMLRIVLLYACWTCFVTVPNWAVLCCWLDWGCDVSTLSRNHPGENRTGEVGNQKVTSKAITSTSDQMGRQIFPADNNRFQQGRKSHNRHSCGPDQSQDGYLKLSTTGIFDLRSLCWHVWRGYWLVVVAVLCVITSLRCCVRSEHFGVKHVSYLGYNFRKIMCCTCSLGNTYTGWAKNRYTVIPFILLYTYFWRHYSAP